MLWIKKNIPISGAGIAGQTLAFWLTMHGFTPTVIESAPVPREDGYMIEFWGSGIDVAEKMGSIEQDEDGVRITF